MSFAGFLIPFYFSFTLANGMRNIQRDNMIGTLQGRINELEFTLARLLHEKAKEGGGLGRSKPLVDLTMWMSSPGGSDHAVTLPSSSYCSAKP